MTPSRYFLGFSRIILLAAVCTCAVNVPAASATDGANSRLCGGSFDRDASLEILLQDLDAPQPPEDAPLHVDTYLRNNFTIHLNSVTLGNAQLLFEMLHANSALKPLHPLLDGSGPRIKVLLDTTPRELSALIRAFMLKPEHSDKAATVSSEILGNRLAFLLTYMIDESIDLHSVLKLSEAFVEAARTIVWCSPDELPGAFLKLRRAQVLLTEPTGNTHKEFPRVVINRAQSTEDIIRTAVVQLSDDEDHPDPSRFLAVLRVLEFDLGYGQTEKALSFFYTRLIRDGAIGLVEEVNVVNQIKRLVSKIFK